MSLAFARDGSLFVATRSAIYRLRDRDGDGRADGQAASQVPVPLVRLDTPGDYPHNGLSGFAFDAFDSVYFGLGENLGAAYRLIGSDGTTLAPGTRLLEVGCGVGAVLAVIGQEYEGVRLFGVDIEPKQL